MTKFHGFLRAMAVSGFLYSLFSCSSPPLNMVQHAEFAPPDSEAAWARYHWYAVDYSQEYITSQFIDNGYEHLRSYSHFQLIAKALTPEGSQVGTLPLKGLGNHATHLEVELYDSLGRKVELDRHVLDSVFREKDVLVFPRVTAGCVVAVNIRNGPYGVFNYWEYPIGLNVPVFRASVRIAYPSYLRYAVHGYNGLPEPSDSVLDGKRTLTWRAGNVLPVPDLPFLDRSHARPTLLLVATRNKDGENFPDWTAVTKYIRKVRFDHSLFNRNGKLKKKARELAQGLGDSVAIAKRLLEWTQDNITMDDKGRLKMDPDEVMETGRGTRWQIATVLSTLFTEMDLANDIVLTRLRATGGFDAGTPNPEAAFEPINLVRVGGKEWAACPHMRWFGLGGYPADCIGLSALSLVSGRPRELPPSCGNRSDISVGEDLANATGKRTLQIDLENLAAADARKKFSQTGLTRETCEKFLAERGFRFSLENCTGSGLDNRDEPLRLMVTAKSSAITFDDSQAMHTKFQAIWSSPAWFYDSARVAEYFFPYEQKITEYLSAKLVGQEKLDVACQEIQNPIFAVGCKRGMVSGQSTITRETVFPAGRHPAAALRALHADLLRLSSSPTAEIGK